MTAPGSGLLISRSSGSSRCRLEQDSKRASRAFNAFQLVHPGQPRYQPQLGNDLWTDHVVLDRCLAARDAVCVEGYLF